MKVPDLQILARPSRVTLFPAACSLDLGDGSERGEYVDQDYILTVLKRPHRSINLMYCYYPFDKGWPLRASAAHKPKGDRPWPYPYDDYFPFSGGPQGDTEGKAFQEMRDIRRHGQDVTLTLTMDCKVPDSHIRAIARQLRPYGRLRLRLNHECDGFWFAFNRRYTYRQVADFFIRFAKVMKKEAPLIQVMCCWGHPVDLKTGELTEEKALGPILPAADLWSTDKYLTLHYGWPYKTCEPGERKKTYNHYSVEQIWKELKVVHRRFCQLSGQQKGLEMGEFNADGNVGGEAHQRDLTLAFYERVLRERPAFLTGITFYQFRDRSRLGLEKEDPNNIQNGMPTLFLEDYKRIIRHPYFTPRESWATNPGSSRMVWRSAEDSEGLGYRLKLKKRPVFVELLLDPKANLMIWAGRQWFYKKPGVDWVDITNAAVEWGTAKPFPIRLFAPPADGMNPGGASRVVSRLSGPPQARVRYDAHRWIKP